MSEEETFELKINESYADSYERRKKEEDLLKIKEQIKGREVSREELEKILERKKKYGVDKKFDEEEGLNVYVDEDGEVIESDEEVEDDNGELLTPAVESQILRAIALIKKKDETIYKPDTVLFDEKATEEAKQLWEKKKKTMVKEKPLTLKHMEMQNILEEAEEKPTKEEEIPASPTHEEEQKFLKDELKKAMFAGDEDQSSDDELLVKREKTTEEEEKEELEYKEFIYQEMSKLDPNDEIFGRFNKDSKSNDPEDAFLTDYIMNRGWVDKSVNRVPTYDEVVGIIEDEEQDEEADAFESKYNFRFEDPNACNIISHPREIGDSVRTKVNKRAEARKRKAERKKMKKSELAEETKKAKNQKMQEIMRAIDDLRKATGDRNITFQSLDNTFGDFDPAKYDQAMAETFNEDAFDDGDGDEKPVFDDDINIDDIEAEQTPAELDEAKQHALKLIGDYYNLDNEGDIEGVKTKFKYRTVEPESFGLEVSDILLADDKDLNAVVPIKAIAPYVDPSIKSNIKVKRNKIRALREKLIEDNLVESDYLDAVEFAQKTRHNNDDGKSNSNKKKKVQ